ncbi:C-C motif chemokine 4-like [Athene cunicularia]|uniref:C-C motif chemokine 4-like n=1 Tax=Athene cunicularia TaxID=194338 RepID=UPI000EF6E546|nr:C-C motif chemokine 4-like [Athene cunicularia]
MGNAREEGEFSPGQMREDETLGDERPEHTTWVLRVPPPGAPAVPDKCCFIFQARRIKRDNIITCYPTSPECPHQAVIFRLKNGKEICTQAARAWVKKYQQSFQVSSFSLPS